MATNDSGVVGGVSDTDWGDYKSSELDGDLIAGLVFALLDPKVDAFDVVTRRALYSFIDAIGCRRKLNKMLRFDVMRGDIETLRGMVEWACNGDWEFADSVIEVWLKGVSWAEPKD